jgi:heat shock protein HslJ
MSQPGNFLPGQTSLPGDSNLSRAVSSGPAGIQTPTASGVVTNLDFTKDGTLNGNLGCNGFSGNYQVANGNIGFGMMISTMMACVGPGYTQEGIGLKIMNGTVRYAVSGNQLMLYAASSDNTITFSRKKLCLNQKLQKLEKPRSF